MNSRNGWTGVAILIGGMMVIGGIWHAPNQMWLRMGLVALLAVPFGLALWAARKGDPPNSN